MWEHIQNRAHTQLAREHSATVVSPRWAAVDWSWHDEWNECARAILHFDNNNNNNKSAGGEWMAEHSLKISKILASEEKNHHHNHMEAQCPEFDPHIYVIKFKGP